MNIPKKKNMHFFLMSQGSFRSKIRFPGQKLGPVLGTDRHTDRVISVGTLSGFQDVPLLQPIIKDRPNNSQEHESKQIARLFKL